MSETLPDHARCILHVELEALIPGQVPGATRRGLEKDLSDM